MSQNNEPSAPGGSTDPFPQDYPDHGAITPSYPQDAPSGPAAPGPYASGAPQGGPGQNPYASPYGYAPPGMYTGYQGQYPGPGPSNTNGIAIAALIVGLISLMMSAIPIINAISIVGGITALILGIVGLRTARSGSAGGHGMALTGVITGSVAFVVSISVIVALTRFVGTVVDTVETATADLGYTTLITDETYKEAKMTALPLGESAQLGDYTVTVTSVDPDATDTLAAVDPTNDSADNRYVLVEMTVTYNGDGRGFPEYEVEPTYLGTKDTAYETGSCPATTPNSLDDVPAMTTGDTASYSVCMDVPANAISGGHISVEAGVQSDEHAYWATS